MPDDDNKPPVASPFAALVREAPRTFDADARLEAIRRERLERGRLSSEAHRQRAIARANGQQFPAPVPEGGPAVKEEARIITYLRDAAGENPAPEDIVAAVVRAETRLKTVARGDIREAFGVSEDAARKYRAAASKELKLETIDKPSLIHWAVIRLQAVSEQALREAKTGKPSERINWSRLAVSSLGKLLDYASMTNPEQEHWDSLSRAEKIDRLAEADHRIRAMREAMGPEADKLLEPREIPEEKHEE